VAQTDESGREGSFDPPTPLRKNCCSCGSCREIELLDKPLGLSDPLSAFFGCQFFRHTPALCRRKPAGGEHGFVPQQCPGDPHQLARQRDDDRVPMRTTQQTAQPTTKRCRCSGQPGQSGSRPLDDELAQIFTAALSDPEQLWLAARRCLTRHQPQPGREIAPPVEGAAIADRGNQRGPRSARRHPGRSPAVVPPDYCVPSRQTRRPEPGCADRGRATDRACHRAATEPEAPRLNAPTRPTARSMRRAPCADPAAPRSTLDCVRSACSLFATYPVFIPDIITSWLARNVDGRVQVYG
jgi:hypothetical protein